MTDEVEKLPGADMSVASVARMYDYYLGGSENTDVDREAARLVLGAAPDVPLAVLGNREFLKHAIRFLATRLASRSSLTSGLAYRRHPGVILTPDRVPHIQLLIRHSEAGRRNPSEQYRLLYRKAFAMSEGELFGEPSVSLIREPAADAASAEFQWKAPLGLRGDRGAGL